MYKIRKSEVGIEILISPRRSAGKIHTSVPMQTSKFQHIFVSFKSVSFNLNCPETSEYQSGRLKSYNQRNPNTFLFTETQ